MKTRNPINDSVFCELFYMYTNEGFEQKKCFPGVRSPQFSCFKAFYRKQNAFRFQNCKFSVFVSFHEPRYGFGFQDNLHIQ